MGSWPDAAMDDKNVSTRDGSVRLLDGLHSSDSSFFVDFLVFLVDGLVISSSTPSSNVVTAVEDVRPQSASTGCS